MRMRIPDWRRHWPAMSALAYALFVFVVPIVRGGGWLIWSLAIGSFGTFAYLYVDFFRQCAGHVRRALLDLSLMAALGFALVPFNVGAAAYIVYAAGLAPMVLPPRQSAALLFALAIGVAVQMASTSGSDRLVIGGWVILLIFIVGLGNLFIGERERQHARLRQAREDVEEMAKVAERERIARDLHDLLGHTLSVIALKSELASKLAERDLPRAVEEIREVERVSREALKEVRAAVEGYNGRGFSGELQSAQQALGSAGVRLDADVGPVTCSPRQETVLALALRETVTNVVRHARASVCRVALGVDHGDLVLTIHDDGIGGPLREGNGLTGMRERVTAAGGRLDVEAAHGVKVRIRFPSTGLAAS